MPQIKKNILLWIFLCLGIIASLVLLCLRIDAESRSDKAACAVTYDSVLLLAAESGKSADTWLRELYDIGVSYLIVTDQNEAECAPLARELGYGIGRSGSSPKAGDGFIAPFLAPDEVQAPEAFYTEDTPIAVIENPYRTGVYMPQGFNAEKTTAPMIKAMYMYNAYSYHYTYAEPATKNENILYGGVFERGLRLIIFTPLYDESKQMVTDIGAYGDIISGLKDRLAKRGITLGRELSVLPAPAFDPLLFFLSGLLLVAAAVVVLGRVAALSDRIKNILLLSGAAVCAAGTAAAPALTQKIWALGASLLFGCAAALVLSAAVKTASEKPLAAAFIKLFFALLALGLCSGMYIGALLTCRSYMLGFDIFSGVKLSQLAPIAFACLWLVYALYSRSARAQLPAERRIPIAVIAAVGIAGIGAVAVLLLRSGDNMLPVSDLEIRFRNMLEYRLYVRPRTKEMLAAFPAIALFAAAAKKRCYILLVPLGAFAAISVSSVINTFCHIFTPVLVSLVRTLSGALIGGVIGIAAMYIFSALLGKEKQN